MEIKSTEFFRNMKSLPDVGTKEFEDLINWEEQKIKEGVTINGVKITGWLYWHLNHWYIRLDEEDKHGDIIRKKQLPNLRDNEWIIAEGLERARLEKKGYLQIGGRQLGKSEMEASYSGMNAIMYQHTQNVILAGNDGDLALMKDKIAFGISNMWEGLKIPQLDKTWTKNMIRLGFKSKNGDDEIWSYIIVRNAADGNNTEGAAGTTAKSFIIDEIGKFGFSQAFEAAKPAFNSKFGWRAVPILVGTGGSFEKGADAERLFFNPEANNFISYDDEQTGAKTGLFMPGIYRQDCKTDSPLGDWLNKEYSLGIEDVSELNKLNIEVVDKAAATEKILEERKVKAKDPDQTEYLKLIMYYPLTPEECFLSQSQNIYNVDAAKKRQKQIYTDNITGFPIEIYHNGEKLTHRLSDKKPISTFPIKVTENKDAPIIMWEPPIPNAPFGLYVAGCLLPGEKVMTDKGLMNVEDVALDNKLINKEGKLVDIINLQRRPKVNEDCYKIKVSNTFRTTTFTKEHPIYLAKQKVNELNRIKEFNYNFDFCKASEAKVNDWVKFPNIYKSSNDFDIDTLWNDEGYRIDRTVESPLKDKDFWWFMGIHLGDGWCESNGYKISASFNSLEKNYFDKYVEVVKKLFNREVSYRERNGCYECYFSFQQLSRFIILHFGKYANGKKIPEWAKRIDEESKKHLLLGYLNSDGCITTHTKGYKGMDYVSINLTLLEDIQDILFSLGIVSGLNRLRKEGKTVFREGKESLTRETYQLRVGHNGTLQFKSYFPNIKNDHKLNKVETDLKVNKRPTKGCFLSDDLDYIYFKITDVEKLSYTGLVYNFECETNTFMCKYIPTHNCDPYRFDEAEYSDSLGAVYIYKRAHSIAGEGLQDTFVASYVARPKTSEEWSENALNLIKYYNAIAMVENDEPSFIKWVINKGDEMYLADGLEWLKTAEIGTTSKRTKGIHRSSDSIRKLLRGSFKQYLNEKIGNRFNDEGEISGEILGVNRVLDPMLLEEIIKFNPDINVDREIAASIAVAYANHLNPVITVNSVAQDPRYKSIFSKDKVNSKSLFSPQKSMFGGKRKSMF